MSDWGAAGDCLRIGSHSFSSRLIVGTGKYASFELMREALGISATECVTVAVPPRAPVRCLGKEHSRLH